MPQLPTRPTLAVDTLDSAAAGGQDFQLVGQVLRHALPTPSETVEPAAVEPAGVTAVVLPKAAVAADLLEAPAVAAVGPSAVAVPTISVVDIVASEGDAYVDVVVRLNDAGTQTVTVAYTTASGSADSGYDFTGVSGTLSFAAGETEKTVRVSLLQSSSFDDGTVEHFRLNLSSPTNATLAKSSAMVTIVDNDNAADTPGLWVKDVVVDEKAGTATFVVTLGGPNGGQAHAGNVTVDYATSAGSATAGSDFSSLSGTLTFAAGETVKNVSVALTDDTTAEGLENFRLQLSNASGATLVHDSATATIGASDGSTSTAPTLSVADMVVGEGDGYVDVVVRLNAPSTSNVSVAYATADVSADTSGYDYYGVSGTLNFAAGETTKTVRVELAGSSSFDTGVLESFRFNLSSPSNATLGKASGVISIVDNDNALAVDELPILHVQDVTVDEKAGTATFVVTLGGLDGGAATGSVVTVNYAVGSGSATSGSDFTGNADPLSGALSFGVGETVKTVTVALTDDTTAEGRENFFLTLSNAVNATIVDAKGTATIGASDGSTSTAPTLSVADMVVGEGDGYVDVVVTLNAPSTSNVSVAYATADVSADTSGYDYYGVSGTLNFAAGETTKTVRVELAGSSSFDSGELESFRFNLSSPGNATLGKASGVISIVDNDNALDVGEVPILHVQDVTVDEKAGTATFVVTLGGLGGGVDLASTVTVDYAVGSGSATSGSDFTGNADPLTGTLSFVPGETVKTVTVALTDDATAEGRENFFLTLSNAANATIVDAKGTATIGASDASTSTAPTLSVADMVVGEGDGYVDVVVTLNAPSTSNVSVAYATADVSADTSGYDYYGVSGTLNFAAGETTKTVRVELSSSSSFDGGELESFRFNLSSPSNATLGKASGVISIVDNDNALNVGEVPILHVQDVTVDEKAGTATFVVTLGGLGGGVDLSSTVTVDYAVGSGSATSGSDFTGNADPLTGTLSFVPGETVKTVTVALTDDATAEGRENFFLTLSNAANATITDAKGTATIGASDGSTSTAPTLSVADMVVGEGDGYVDVVVTLSAPSTSNVSVAYATADVSADTSGYDYYGVSGTLNFAAGETTKTVRVELAGSSSFDDGVLESLRFNLSSPSNASLGKASAMISIVDNDNTVAVGEQPALYVDDVIVDEKAGTATFVVTLGGLDGGQASASPVRVNYSVGNGSATSGSDFDASADPLSGKLYFAPGETVKTVTVALVDDSTAEARENFFLSLSSAVNATIVDAKASATIGASDGTASSTPIVSVTDTVVSEGDGYVDLEVTLSARSTSNVSVAYSTATGTATSSGYDFESVTGTLNFAAGETTKTVRVELSSSGSFDEGTLEHFRFNLSSATNATLGKSSAMVSIVDNDNSVAVGEQPALVVRDTVVDEKAGTATFYVVLGGPGAGVAHTNTVSVDYTIAGNTATAGSDFTSTLDALTGTLVFGAGETVKAVTVGIVDDTTAEGSERFSLTLDNAVNAVIGDARGNVTIGASDGATAAAPVVNVGAKTVSEGDGYVDMVLSLNKPSTSTVTVAYTTANATAFSGYDYQGVSGNVVFAAGETTKTVRIELDTSSSNDTAGLTENFLFRLTSATNATIGSTDTTVTIIDDDLVGVQVFSGGDSDDDYTIDDSTDVIVESPDGGTDTVFSSITYTLGANLENLTLLDPATTGTGNSLANVLTGNSKVNTLKGMDGNDTLDGKSGADKMTGGGGNDIYIVDNAGDVVTEVSGGGTDTVKSSVTFTLADEVEKLTLTGSNAINGTGNGLANTISGNSGNNVIDGGGGADTMSGAAGNDTYIVNNSGDVVTESAGGGNDLVKSSVTYTLSAEVEKLTLTGSSAINGTGNDLNNTVTGNTGNNVLNGGAGVDTLVGGTGNDTYVIDSTTDTITELSGGGSDTVKSSKTYTLGAELENLVLTGSSAINGLGNGAANTITGNSAANTLTGKGGADTFVLNGFAAADTIADFVTGTDKVRISQAGIKVGDGDTTMEGAVKLTGPGGFAKTAELVIVSANISGSITTSSAAAKIGSATASYAKDATALFVVDNGTNSALYLFKAVDADAAVEANELTLLATFTGASSTATTDFLFGS